jgi:hypothetical protein
MTSPLRAPAGFGLDLFSPKGGKSTPDASPSKKLIAKKSTQAGKARRF